MLAIVQKLGYKDVKSFGVAMAADPKQHATSAEALLELYRGHEAAMKPKLPELFGRLPKNSLEVVAMPAYLGKDQAAAWYAQGTANGSRPGRVNVNEYNFAQRALAPIEAVSYHEGIPGHHLQISIAQELTGLPEFRKYLGYTAFVEGWALYSERLGKEIGFYTDPVSDYGRLEADIWRAIRLVVDTGVHSLHWTRQQMVDYFHDHSAIDETNVQAEVDRYIAWPGQALGYKMGQMKISGAEGAGEGAAGGPVSVEGISRHGGGCGGAAAGCAGGSGGCVDCGAEAVGLLHGGKPRRRALQGRSRAGHGGEGVELVDAEEVEQGGGQDGAVFDLAAEGLDGVDDLLTGERCAVGAGYAREQAV